MKNRKMPPVPIVAAVADAVGAANEAAGAANEAAEPSSGTAGSPLVVAADGFTTFDAAPNSRRDTASAAHINGPAAEPPPPEPEPNQESSVAPRPVTEPGAAAAEGVAMTLAEAVSGGAGTDSTTEVDATGEESAVTGMDAMSEESAVTGMDAAADSSLISSIPVTGMDAVGTEASTGVMSTALRDAEASGMGACDEDPLLPVEEDGAATVASVVGVAVSALRRRSGLGAAALDSPAPTVKSGEASGEEPRDRSGDELGEGSGEELGERSEGELSAEVEVESEPRADRRAGALDPFDDPDDAEAEESEEAEPVAPAEPWVSANAIGIAANPEPTPRATAKAPTRPMYLACRGFGDSAAVTARRRYSIARTRPVATRR
jgi:hypothetical protein